MENNAYPELTDLNIRLQELESQGYTVFPEYLDRDTTAAIRAHIDSLVGPIVSGDRTAARRDLRHPIPGAIMARLVNNPATLELAATLIGSRDLRLREQVFIRSDPSPPPYQAPQWHIDAAFCRAEFEVRPRQVYYQMLHCCSTVSAGGAAFMIVPGSHKLSLAASDKAERAEGRGPIQNHTASVPEANDADGIEICANDGDLIIFNPLCYHSSSPNRTDQPRYVYFTSFYHPSAAPPNRTSAPNQVPRQLSRLIAPRIAARTSEFARLAFQSRTINATVSSLSLRTFGNRAFHSCAGQTEGYSCTKTTKFLYLTAQLCFLALSFFECQFFVQNEIFHPSTTNTRRHILWLPSS